MKLSRSITFATLCCWIFVLGILIAPRALCAGAVTWRATAGAQRTDEGIQALAFLPNELWIYAGDSIKWTFPTGEIHTVTLLQQNFFYESPAGSTGSPGCWRRLSSPKSDANDAKWLQFRWFNLRDLRRRFVRGRGHLHREFSNGR